MTPPPADQFAARVFLGPTLRAQPDRRLVNLVRDGYDAAFEEIVRRYRRPLDRFAAAIVGGHSEDVTQDAFSKALPALRGSEAEIELRPWLYRIVRNTALNDLRDRGPVPEELAETLPGGRSAAAEAEAREEIRDLMSRLQALPEPQRAALVMRELEGLSHEEIAAALGVSGGAARQAIFRARAALRDGLGLLLPMPMLRALAEHGGDAVGAGVGAGVTAGALKVGLATVLVAGTVAGVAIDHHHGDRVGPEAAEAAPLTKQVEGRGPSDESAPAGAASSGGSRKESGDDDGGGDRGRGVGGGADPSLADGRGSGSSGGSRQSGGGSDETSGSHSGRGGPGPSSGSIDDSGSGSRHGGDDGGGDHSGSGSGSGSDDGGSDDRSDSSGGSSGGIESDGGGSGSGSGEDVISEPIPTTEPGIEDGGGSGSDGGSSGSGSGSGDLGSGETSNLDGTP
jgi:RNA polymerase sigma factor (sigma-70 family)